MSCPQPPPQDPGCLPLLSPRLGLAHCAHPAPGWLFPSWELGCRARHACVSQTQARAEQTWSAGPMNEQRQWRPCTQAPRPQHTATCWFLVVTQVLVQCPTCTTTHLGLDSRPNPTALCGAPAPPISSTLMWPPFFFARLWNVYCRAWLTTRQGEGQAVHPPAWPRVSRLSPDGPHRLRPPGRRSFRPGLAEGREDGVEFQMPCGLGLLPGSLSGCVTSGRTDRPSVPRALSLSCLLPGLFRSPHLCHQSSPGLGGGGAVGSRAPVFMGGPIFRATSRPQEGETATVPPGGAGRTRPEWPWCGEGWARDTETASSAHPDSPTSLSWM